MMFKIGDVFRHYQGDELWIGVVQPDEKNRAETQMVQWLVPVQTRDNVLPSLCRNQVTLFDKAWEE